MAVAARAISSVGVLAVVAPFDSTAQRRRPAGFDGDRKSTRLNSSHLVISYAVFCFEKAVGHDMYGDVHLLFPLGGHARANLMDEPALEFFPVLFFSSADNQSVSALFPDPLL